ncbi:MAG: hypothetical protein REJ23_01605 [Brevundimonas sp.]|nr:hypothetical protein [Brevundimonas sp.]
MSTDNSASFDQPPEVIEVENDIILRAPNGEACYTRSAMRQLLMRLGAVLDRSAEGRGEPDAETATSTPSL